MIDERPTPKLWPPANIRRVAGVVMSLGALSIALLGLSGSPNEDLLVVLSQWLFALGIVGVSLTLIMKRPENRFGYVAGWAAVAFAMMGSGQSLGASEATTGNFDAAALWFAVEGVGWSGFILAFLVLLPLWFPTGKAISGPWAVFGMLAIAIALTGAVATFASGSQCVTWNLNDECTQRALVDWGFVAPEVGEDIGFLIIMLGLPAVFSLTMRFRRSSGLERQQLKWFVSAYALLATVIAVSSVLELDIDALTWPVSLSIPVSVAIGVLRYRLYDFDRIVSRTVSWALLAGVLGVAFFGLTALVSSQISDNSLFVAGSTLAVAAVFNPMRRRIQLFVDRRFNRARYDAEQVLSSLTAAIRDKVEPDAVLAGLTTVVEQTIQPAGIGIWVR